jgi:hypothetical protein
MAQVQDQIQVQIQEVHECPICLEEIVGFKNRVTTECGHTFHCRCLLTNAAHNGFGCPFCRAELADAVEDSDDDESEYDEDEYTPARYDDDDEEASRASDYDDDDDDFENEIGYMYDRINQMEEDHLLRGFRWMFQPLNKEDEEEAAEEAAEEAEAEETAEEDDVTVWETDSECDNELDDDLSSYSINITVSSVAAENQVTYNQWPEESSSPTYNSIREYFQNAGFSVRVHSEEDEYQSSSDSEDEDDE